MENKERELNMDEMEKASNVNDAHLTLAKESAIQQISENNANSEM